MHVDPHHPEEWIDALSGDTSDGTEAETDLPDGADPLSAALGADDSDTDTDGSPEAVGGDDLSVLETPHEGFLAHEGSLASGWTQPGDWDVWPNYDPAVPCEVIGEPGRDIAFWHVQQTQTSCAVAAQEFTLESLTGQSFDEGALCQEALAHGWYTPGGGTPAYAVGNLLAAHGVPVIHEQGLTLEHLSAKLAAHQKVIVGVDPAEIWRPGQVDYEDVLAHTWGIPERGATHAVEVIGIIRDPQNPQVILNDPGHPDGRGVMIPAERFLHAWEDSGYMAVSTMGGKEGGSALTSPVLPAMGRHQPALAGYYNADGTYHYTSDNTDRDPETGAIVRRW
jgi:hypothetical protein